MNVVHLPILLDKYFIVLGIKMKINEIIQPEKVIMTEGLSEIGKIIWDIFKYTNLAIPAIKAFNNIKDIKNLNRQGDNRFDTPEEVQSAIELELSEFAVATAGILASTAIIRKIVNYLPRFIPLFGSHPIVRTLTFLLNAGMQVYVMRWINSEEGRTFIAKWLTGQLLVGGPEANRFVGRSLDIAFTKLGEFIPDSARRVVGLEPLTTTTNQGGQTAEPRTADVPELEPDAKQSPMYTEPGEFSIPGWVRNPKTGQMMPKTGIASIDNPK